MKRVKIKRKFFWGKRKAEVMQVYNLSEEEYHFIQNKGLQRDANNKVLEEWVVEIPDNLGACASSNKNRSYTPQAGNDMYGASFQQAPPCPPSPTYSLQQQYQKMAQDCMEEAKWNYETAENERMNFRSPEEYYYFIECGNRCQQQAEYYLNMANNIQYNQVSSTFVSNTPFGQTSTNVTAVNNPYSDMYMGMGLANYGTDIIGNLAINVAKVADAIERIKNLLRNW